MKPDMMMTYRPGAEWDSKGEGVICNLCSHYSRQPGPTIHNDGCPIAYLEALGPLHDEWLRTYTHCRDEGSIDQHIAAEIALAFHLVETP
jgi:hypothetical protein